MAKSSSRGPVGTESERSWGENPLTNARRVLLGFIQELFAQAPKGQFHWSSNIKETDVVITDQNPINVESTGVKPLINCVRGPVQFNRICVDDFQSHDMNTGTTRFSDLTSGTLSLNAISKNDIEAEHLAWLCARHVWLLRKILMGQGFHDIGRGIQITAPTPAGAMVAPKNVSDWRKVTVFIPYHFRYSDYIKRLDVDTAQTIATSVTAEANTSIGTDTAPRTVVVRVGD